MVKRRWSGSLPVALIVVLLVTSGVKLQRVDWLRQAIGVVILFTMLDLLLALRLLHMGRGVLLAKPVKFKTMQPTLTVTAVQCLAFQSL